MTHRANPVFEQLRDLLEDETEDLNVIHDTPDHYEVRLGRKLFAGVIAQKHAVEYHLRPLEAHPELLDGLSDALRRRLQGRSRFVFKDLPPGAVAELAALTAAAFQAVRGAGTDSRRASR